MLNVWDFIHVFVFTTNHHLKTLCFYLAIRGFVEHTYLRRMGLTSSERSRKK